MYITFYKIIFIFYLPLGGMKYCENKIIEDMLVRCKTITSFLDSNKIN